MARHYLTANQAETMARLYYGLPERSYHGRPLRNQHVVRQALQRKLLVIGHQLTEKGLRELRSYCKWLRSKQT